MSGVRSSVPACLTVEEAAAVMRIGRGSAYAGVNEFLDSGGAAGIPAIRIGRKIRVPFAALEALLGGHIAWPLSTKLDVASNAGLDRVPRSTSPSRVDREAVAADLQLSFAIES